MRFWRGVFLAVTFLMAVPATTAICNGQSKMDFRGEWTVGVKTPGGELRFRLVVPDHYQENVVAILYNGPERTEVAGNIQGGKLALNFPHYDSSIELLASLDNPSVASGTWTKTRGAGKQAILQVEARRGVPTYSGDSKAFIGRWRIKFADDESPAVGVFQAGSRNGEVLGTILTATGDYRYLHGGVDGDQLNLACFDGAHAFLFQLDANETNSQDRRSPSPLRTIRGEFYSGDWYQVEMEGYEDEHASLPDGFAAVQVQPDVELKKLQYADATGNMRRLVDDEPSGKVTVIEVFGTWCPNCHDEAVLLSELHREYSPEGLEIVGLAFELTSDRDRSWRQINRYRKRYDVNYPILLAAGTSDKQAATKLFPVLDQIRSYPTTLFVDQTGAIRAVYSGFSGPATGEAHEKLKSQFRKIIERLLAE